MVCVKAFSGCSRLSSVAIEPGSKLVHIAPDAFESCGSLRSFVIPASLQSLTGFAFRRPQLREITVDGDTFCAIPGEFLIEPEGFRAICWFGERSDVVVDSSIRIFGECCFSSREDILSSLERIGDSGFSDCTRLSSVTFESDSRLSSIGHYAFRGCSSLTSICIPSSVRSMGHFCFGSCPGLSNLTFESNSRLLRFVQRSELFIANVADMLELYEQFPDSD
jgi:hypothetical protein